MKRLEKCTESIKLWLGEILYFDLKAEAAKQGFDSLSTFIRKILREYLYGKITPQRDLLAGAVRDD
jgi:hypothetical protein